jgi:hypothetical protein
MHIVLGVKINYEKRKMAFLFSEGNFSCSVQFFHFFFFSERNDDRLWASIKTIEPKKRGPIFVLNKTVGKKAKAGPHHTTASFSTRFRQPVSGSPL